MKLLTIILLAILIIIIIIFAIAAYLARFMARPKLQTRESETNYAKENGLWDDYDKLQTQTYDITSFDGYLLKAEFIPAPGGSTVAEIQTTVAGRQSTDAGKQTTGAMKDASNRKSDKYVIISHGYSGNRFGSVKYVNLYRKLGFNCLIFDNRGHGENMKAPCTMGYKESRDLMSVIDHVYERFGDDIILGLHGESMGSGMTVNALQYSPKVKFIVSDCGYNDLKALLMDLVGRKAPFAKFIVYPASLISKIFYGYYISEVSPKRYVAYNEIPILYVHGREDRFIPVHHAQEMFELNNAHVRNTGRGTCKLSIYENAHHAGSIVTDREGYLNMLRDFLEGIGII